MYICKYKVNLKVLIMKKIITLCLLSIATIGYSQSKKPSFEKEGDRVKATYFYDNGAVKTQGYFKNNKLSGQWVSFNEEGKKVKLAYYKEGKKVGKWFIWTKDNLKEINYDNNALISVKTWKNETSVAINND